MTLPPYPTADRPGQIPPKPPLFIVADDLTGACDAAVAFAGPKMEVVVAIHPGTPPRGDVFATNTRSRDIDAKNAVARLSDISGAVRVGDPIFKKVDSVFRGNTFAEIAFAVQSFPADLALLAPAYPALGRCVRGGRLEAGADSRNGIDIVAHVRPTFPTLAQLSTGLSIKQIADELQLAAARRTRLVICDATETTDLDTLVRGVEASQLNVLWIGSGGLAHALASATGETTGMDLPHRQGRVLFFTGSDHPATTAQLTLLQHHTGISLTPCGAASRAQGDMLIQVTRGQATHEDVRSAVARVPAHNVGCIFATGGDTALLICEALGIDSLLMQGELAPGVPVALVQGGRFDGVPFVLKSGGFGDNELLCRIHAMFSRKEVAAQ